MIASMEDWGLTILKKDWMGSITLHHKKKEFLGVLR